MHENSEDVGGGHRKHIQIHWVIVPNLSTLFHSKRGRKHSCLTELLYMQTSWPILLSTDRSFKWTKCYYKCFIFIWKQDLICFRFLPPPPLHMKFSNRMATSYKNFLPFKVLLSLFLTSWTFLIHFPIFALFLLPLL